MGDAERAGLTLSRGTVDGAASGRPGALGPRPPYPSLHDDASPENPQVTGEHELTTLHGDELDGHLFPFR